MRIITCLSDQTGHILFMKVLKTIQFICLNNQTKNLNRQIFNPKKGKTIKRHQKIIYRNSNNTISWFFILVFVSLRTRRSFGGINALKTEHLFINACYNLAVIPEHFTNQWFSVTISLLLQNGHQIWNLDSMFCQDYKKIRFSKTQATNVCIPQDTVKLISNN